MDPIVVAAEAAEDCPVCGMNLVAIDAEAKTAAKAAASAPKACCSARGNRI